ncbi:hypothetical protein ONZ43_g682 [Nemania bipapillata]|uniref:Uncharacterized protein n=1 Tax=Nemania bipapillata TaxID=110536 RepID=A0ACC2J7A5_9PEZI|nr:hypothetical protein ONZ43_g682 [Nemania bipapillata]
MPISKSSNKLNLNRRESQADGSHGDDLDVADGQANEEARKAALPEDHAGSLGDAQAAAIADGAGDLHAAADDLEGV